ncbi:MAG: hypothetical protein J6O56_02125 [Bacilli bacterium]|nr:hypothetical protein [Bacilli bacterium]
MGFRDRIFDMLDQRRRGRINDAERRANIESRSIDAREAALNNILSQTSNFRDNLILQSQRDNLEHRRQDLENYRENIDQERRKFENLDTLLNGPDDNTINPYIPDETTVREFRTEYRRVQRSERNYRTREIANALITGAAIIGVAWTLDQIDPSFINFNDTAQSINDSVQTGIHTVNVVLERFSNVAETIMNNPTFESVRDVINNGPAQLLTTSIVSAVYLRRTTRFHRLANEQQAERESMEENNPISVAEYVNNVRHL